VDLNLNGSPSDNESHLTQLDDENKAELNGNDEALEDENNSHTGFTFSSSSPDRPRAAIQLLE
jgi:hypothetical protein